MPVSDGSAAASTAPDGSTASSDGSTASSDGSTAAPAGPARSAVELRDGEVVLRGFHAADVPALLDAFADTAITAWNPGPAERSAEAATAWASERADWSSGTHASWAISGDDGTLLGSISLFQLDPDQRDGEIGYWLVPAGRGRGIASRAVRLAAAYAFEELGVRRLTLFHAVDNHASCRVAIAAGFALEGTLRQSHRYGDGSYHDEHVHGRLATDAPPPDRRPSRDGVAGR